MGRNNFKYLAKKKLARDRRVNKGKWTNTVALLLPRSHGGKISLLTALEGRSYGLPMDQSQSCEARLGSWW